MTSEELETSLADNRKIIESIVFSQAKAWNKADAEAFAEHYSEEGSFTNIAGTRIYGKAGFVAQHAKVFRTIFEGSQLKLTVDRVHFPRPDVAVVDIDALLSKVKQLPPSVRSDADGALHTRLLEVLTSDGSRWWIASFHNIAVAPD